MAALNSRHQVAGGEVQFGCQDLQRPVAGEVGFEQAHRLHDRGMHRPGLSGRHTASLRDRLAELAEQERQATDDIGPVQRERSVPQRGQRIQMNKALADGSRLEPDRQHAAAGRRVRAGPQQEPEQRVLPGPGQFSAQQFAAEAAVVHLEPLAVLVPVPDPRPEQDEPCNPSWFERLATSSLLANQVSQFDVNHAQVTNGLDVAVGIQKGIISMSNPRYAEAWKILGQLVPYSASGQSGYGACQDPNVTTPPLSPQPLLVQGKVGMLWGGSWWIPQLDSAGFTGKFGVFPEPPITSATTPLALGTSTLGVIGGPNGNGQWSITSQRADSTMTPAKTATVMNFVAWLFTPQHLGYWLKISGSGSYIPTVTGAPTVNLPGLESLVPTGKVPTVVDVVLDDVLSAAATNSGMRLVQEYINGSLSYSAFASQWQSLLTSSAQAWATQNHVDLSKY